MLPQVGKTVTVVVNAHPHMRVFVPLWNDFTIAGPETHTYTGVVVKRDYWMKNDEFNLTTGLKHFPVRTISMKNVVSIDGKRIGQIKGDDVKVVKVPASKGGTHDVTVRNGVAEHCSCKGFQFRQSCRHLGEV